MVDCNQKNNFIPSKYYPLDVIHFCTRPYQFVKHFRHSEVGISNTNVRYASNAFSVVENRLPSNYCFIFENRYKSHDTKSGL